MNNLDPRAKTLFLVQHFLSLIFILGFISLIFLSLLLNSLSLVLGLSVVTLPVVIISFLLTCLLFFAVSKIFADLTYNNFKYVMEESQFKVEKGVIFKKYVSIPYSRVQNIDITRGILDRFIGTSTLKIQTAGVSGRVTSEGLIPGLDKDVAVKLRDEVLGKIN